MKNGYMSVRLSVCCLMLTTYRTSSALLVGPMHFKMCSALCVSKPLSPTSSLEKLKSALMVSGQLLGISYDLICILFIKHTVA